MRQFLDTLVALVSPVAFAVAVAVASDGLKW